MNPDSIRRVRAEQSATLLQPIVASTTGEKAEYHNDHEKFHSTAGSASAYPLKLEDKLFFSEAIATSNPDHLSYRKWICDCLGAIESHDGARGIVNFAELDGIGAKIQRLDENWVRKKISDSVDLDSLHLCYGPDDNHPYRKITLCRTTLPILFNGNVCRVFYEKFLVVYSFWSYRNFPEGKRKLTITPLHSHPMNFEVVYFAKFDESSCVREEEYTVQVCVGDKEQDLIVGTESRHINPNAVVNNSLRLDLLRAKPVSTTTWQPTQADWIRQLEPFQNDIGLANPSFLKFTDSLFRPHKVTVFGQPETTHYFAINNYFSLHGEVYLYQEDGRLEELWDHDSWAGIKSS